MDYFLIKKERSFKLNKYMMMFALSIVLFAIVTNFNLFFIDKTIKNVKLLDEKNPIELEIEGYKKILSNNKNNFVVLNKLSYSYLKLAKFSGNTSWYLLSEQKAKESLSLSPINNYQSYLVLASISMAKHDFENAIKISNKVLENPYLRSQSLQIIFDAYMAKGDFSKAQKILLKMKENLPLVTVLTDNGIKKIYKKDPIILTQEALLFDKIGRDSESENNFISAINSKELISNENKAWILSLYSSYLIRHGNIDLAKSNLVKSLQLKKDYIPSIILQANIYQLKKDWNSSINILSKIDNNNITPDILLKLAESYKEIGNNEQYYHYINIAESKLKEEININSFGHRRDYIKLLLLKNTKDSMKEATIEINKELKFRKDLDTLLLAIQIEIENKNFDKAFEYINISKRIGFKDSKLMFFEGKYYLEKKDVKKAKELYSKAMNFNRFFDPQMTLEANNFISKY